jgi:hypothetical protein
MNPFAGSWKANLSTSQRHPNHQFQSATLHFDFSEDVVRLTHAGINMDGKYESGVTTLHLDGREHPVSEQAPGIVVVTQRVGEYILETLAKRDGKVIGQGVYEVCVDGKTLTAKVSGTDAGDKEFEQTIVFDRG